MTVEIAIIKVAVLVTIKTVGVDERENNDCKVRWDARQLFEECDDRPRAGFFVAMNAGRETDNALGARGVTERYLIERIFVIFTNHAQRGEQDFFSFAHTVQFPDIRSIVSCLWHNATFRADIPMCGGGHYPQTNDRQYPCDNTCEE